jgi:uncharacterized lipoprotein YddW (UPF0748 family)
MLKVLDGAGVTAVPISDHDVEEGALAGRTVAVFPYNLHVTIAEVSEIEKFIAEGGRVLTFFSSNRGLLNAIGFEPGRHTRPSREAEFSSIVFGEEKIVGMPASTAQASWNISTATPKDKGARVLASWRDSRGGSTGHAALLISDAGAYLSHILLTDDLEAKRQMMRALIGHFDPSIWEAAAQAAITRLEEVGEYRSFKDASDAILASSSQEGHTQAAAAAAGLKLARSKVRDGQHADAVTVAQEARNALVAAYGAAQEPKANEMRALWCHSAQGVPGKSWDEVLGEVADAGFNMILPNMLWGGIAYYESDVLPRAADLAKTGDRITEIVAASKKHDVDVHVWKVNWNLVRADSAFRQKAIDEGRIQRDPRGEIIEFLCPSSPINFALERDSMVEVAKNYDVAGIHFDYIRYPNRDGCFCDPCRERFEAIIGEPVKNWPADALRNGVQHEAYQEFRRSNITRLVKAVSEEARRVRPDIKISAAVFRNWPDCRESVAQDWVAWIEAGYLDFVCPMNYTNEPAQFEEWNRTQLDATGHKIPFLPGIGVTSSASSLSPDKVVEQIKIARSQGADGFTIFNLGSSVLTETLPYLKQGLTSRR